MDTPADPIDPMLFRATMGRFATGVTVITVAAGNEVRGMTANAFMSVSLSPPLVLVSINNRARIRAHLGPEVRYGVNVLAENQEAVSRHFAGRPQEGLDVRFIDHRGTPLIEGCVAHIVARIVDIHPAGDHTLYIGHVEHLRWWERRPLLFFAGMYEQLVSHYITDISDWNTFF